MANAYTVTDDHGVALDARFSIAGQDILLHARRGTKGKGAINTDYSKALLQLLTRLAQSAVHIRGAWVDSTTVQRLPLSKRKILEGDEGDLLPVQLFKRMTGRMKDVRGDLSSKAKGGNSTKRIRIATDFAGSPEDLAALLGGVPVAGDFRSLQRLPAETLRRATPEYIWAAVQQFLTEVPEHRFGPSTDFDLIADDGRRLPPKAVFGVALSMALGNEPVGPEHFTAGENSTCFRLLRAAGYQVVRKDASATQHESTEDDLEFDQEWSEGRAKLVAHRKRERAKGLSKAKKAQYLRIHGRLRCERCDLDPVAHYGSEYAEACIEVHHVTPIHQMTEGHRTTLNDLQCLCANCHRLVHREMAVEITMHRDRTAEH